MVHSRTTLHDVGEMSRHFTVLPPRASDISRRITLLGPSMDDMTRRLHVLAPGIADPAAVVRHAAMSLAIGLTLMLLAAMVFAGGAWRLVLGVVAGTGATTLVVFATLRLVSKLASKRGDLVLPGPALLWVGMVMLVAVAAGVGATWGVSEVTKPLVEARRIATAAPRVSASASAAPSSLGAGAHAAMKRGQHVSMGDGVLYVPPYFESRDGSFDLIVHYHGNVELVEQSVAASRINALVRIINYGDGSDRYSEPLKSPTAFDNMLGAIEERAASLGLQSPRLRRVALASWSAGFGAVFHILSSRSRLDRIDAVLLMDSLHSMFAPNSKSEVYPPGVKPFIAFARRAVAGEKLMMVTHSSIETEGYASTTQTADALLRALGLERTLVDPQTASPPDPKLKVALMAFPEGERRWLSVTSEARKGGFHLLGCKGNGKGDHIAQLAQMSVSVLPPLAERWK